MGRPRKHPAMRAGKHVTKAEAAAELAAIEAAKTIEPPKVEPLGSAPATLSAEGLAIWRAAAPELERLKLLALADRIAFERYCEWLARFRKLQKQMRRQPLVDRRSKNMQRMSAGYRAMLEIDSKLMAYEDDFGMTPKARQAIFAKLAAGAPATPPPPPDPPKADQAPMARGPVGILRSGLTGPTRLQ